jgi:hypothetical protein
MYSISVIRYKSHHYQEISKIYQIFSSHITHKLHKTKRFQVTLVAKRDLTHLGLQNFISSPHYTPDQNPRKIEVMAFPDHEHLSKTYLTDAMDHLAHRCREWLRETAFEPIGEFDVCRHCYVKKNNRELVNLITSGSSESV